MNKPENFDLIKALRDLDKKLKESQKIAGEAAEKVEQVHHMSQDMLAAQFARMIEAQPELYGLHGTRRNWLVRQAELYGLDDDRMPGDIGPHNNPNL